MYQSIIYLVLISICLGQTDYYGRCYGTAASWYRNDNGDSHHLEVNMNPVNDLDSGNQYDNFQANIDIESTDGSSLLVVVLQTSDLQTAGVLDIISANNTNGLMQLDESDGIDYTDFLDPSDFNPLAEDDYYNLLTSLLKNATNVFFFGQVYMDSNGNVGIHDIHEIDDVGYGDGGFITVDAQNNYYGVFAHFDDQPGLKINPY